MWASLKFFFAISTISLKDDPIKIFDTKLPFFLSVLTEKFSASILNYPVTNESTFLFPVVFTAISERTTSILLPK